MEMPFKYIILYIVKILNDRNMPLIIDKNILKRFLTEFIKKSFFTIEEKKEICDNFNFEYEWNDFKDEYIQYFDLYGDKISFDKDYINKLDKLIKQQVEEYGIVFIHDVDWILNGDVSFLEILGIKLKKELYEFLLDIETELELCYIELCDLETYVGKKEVDINNLINEMKKINMQKIIMLINTKNLLSNTEYRDLILYASNVVDKEDDNNLSDLSLLTENIDFNESDIMQDVFLKSIFTGNDLHTLNLRDVLILNRYKIPDDKKHSKVNFYLTFLDILSREIDKYDGELNTQLIRIKYRVMNVLDSVYGNALFLDGKTQEYNGFQEDYDFISDAVNYFIDEVLKYDDELYRNKEFNTDNIMVYLNNIMKKILIETYYKLTKDNSIVKKINEHELYGVNTISSNLLKEIIDKPKTKTKEI